jgi:long-chain acyl-CoA synthetase
MTAAGASGDLIREDTVGAMVWNRKERFRDRDYVQTYRDGAWEWMTWGRYGAIVEEIAHGLMALGIQRGQVAGIVSQTRLEWGLADLGILTIGAVTVTVYPTLVPEDVAYILGHAEARIAFVENEHQLARVASVRDRLPALEWIVPLTGTGDGDGVLTLDALRQRGAAHQAEHPGAWRARIEGTRPADLATLVYTSGTTGPPKGAMISHANFIQTCEGLAKLDLVTPTDHSISYLPLSHIYERISTYMYGMYSGGTCGIARGMETLIDDIQAIRPTVMVGVPRVYEKIYAGIMRNLTTQSPTAQTVFRWALDVGRQVRATRDAGRRLPPLLFARHRLAERLVYRKVRGRFGGRLRFLVSAAAPIAREILEFFDALGIAVVEGYGMTETTGPATLPNLRTVRIGTLGRALPGVEVDLAPDGEILVRGVNVFQGYFKQPEATAEALADGWLHTGDIGELSPDGFLKITDRKKDLIITAGGKNIAPQNLENRLKMDAMIAEAFVYGDRRQYLTALLTLDEPGLRAWADAHGLAGSDHEALTRRPEVEAMIGERVEAFNRGVARFESIKKFRILPTQFSIETGELTPTMKLKRKVVVAKYRDLIDAMYAE